MRHFGKLTLVVMLLFFDGCSPTDSADSNQNPDAPNQTRLAGYRLQKWYKADNSAVTVRFPHAIFQDESGRYWVGNGVGLASYDEVRNEWTNISVEALRWRVGDIQQIAESSDRRLWIRSTAVLSDNVRFFDGNRWNSVPRIAESRVSVIFPGADRKLWFAVGDQIVAYESGEWSRGQKVSDSIRSPKLPYIFRINAGMEDRSGLVWLAIRDGIVRLGPLARKQESSFEQEHLSHVRCMYEDDIGRVWAGNDEGFISVFERSNGSWHRYDLSEHLLLDRPKGSHVGFSKVSVNAILQDKSGQMIISTTHGLLTVDQSGGNWQAFTHQNSLVPEGGITAMLRDKSGRIWLGTGEGILVLE